MFPAGAAAAERQYFVAPSGDDAADGSTERPWKTVARGIQAAGPGVTLNLRAGVYLEAPVVEQGGAEGLPFTLQNAPGERAVLDGEFRGADGITLRAPFVTLRGLEVRQYPRDGIYIKGPSAHHIVVERNVVHHISSSLAGEGEGARGIWALGVSDCTIRQNTVYGVVGNSESFGILFDLRSSFKVSIRNALIEKNLIYLVDKSGVRVVDNSHPATERCHVLATPAFVRENILLHNAYSGIEINYVNTSVTEGAGPLNGAPGAAVYTEHNFIGWCGSFGLNPKQTNDGISRWNTVYRTCGIGYLQSGEPSARMRIEGNLFSDNTVGAIVHTVGTDNRFTGNYYRQAAPWLDFFWDRTKGWGTTYSALEDLRQNSSAHQEPQGVLNNEREVFAALEQGDFRLRKGCPAEKSAPGGGDFGAAPARLAGVGASTLYGLGRIPLLPEIQGLRVVECSSEDPNPVADSDPYYSGQSRSVDLKKITSGLAQHLVDGVLNTVWRPAQGATTGWVVFELSGEKPLALGACAVLACHTAYQGLFNRHVKQFKLYVRAGKDDPWKEAGAYTRYKREEGRIFFIAGAPLARQVKLEVLSNHGAALLEVAEFRLYGVLPTPLE